MSLLFYGVGATNGYNADGHYIRVAPVVGSCTAYARTPSPAAAPTSPARARRRRRSPQGSRHTCGKTSTSKVRQAAPLSGLLRYLTGSKS